MSEVTKDDEPLSVRLKPLRAALDGLAFAAYEAGANGETMLGDCDDVAEWIEEAMSRAAEAVAAPRTRWQQCSRRAGCTVDDGRPARDS